MWAYKRGQWVDTEFPGTWKGVPATENEEDLVAAETAELDARLVALNYGCEEEDVRKASWEEVKRMTAEAEAQEKRAREEAEAAELAEIAAAEREAAAETERLRKEHEANVDKAGVMERLLPKLEQRLVLKVKEPEDFEKLAKEGGAEKKALQAAKGKGDPMKKK
tara:strand:- start:38 stop:532 length:495 start_codon:yes stop_codon:yes gene_type:complete